MRVHRLKAFIAAGTSLLAHLAVASALLSRARSKPETYATRPSPATTDETPAPTSRGSYEVPIERDPGSSQATPPPPASVPLQAPPLPVAAEARPTNPPIAALVDAPSPATATARAPLSSGAPPVLPPANAAATATSGASSAALFGATQDRSASDLAAAFARTFPQAARGDPLWLRAAFGSAGDALVTLVIDDAGHLQGDPDVRGGVSAALASNIARTFAKIHGGSFTSRGARTTLQISATITPKKIDAYALGDGPFDRDVASAFFELPPDRRIDVRVRLLP